MVFLTGVFFLAAPGLVDFLTVFFLVAFLAAAGFLVALFFLVAALGFLDALFFLAMVFLTGVFFLASGESLNEAFPLMNMPLETPNLSAFLSARSFLAAGKLDAMYFLMAASE